MTDPIDSPADAPAAAPKKRSGGLNSMLLADLKAMAAGMGISGAATMKKAQIVEAIKAAQVSQVGQPQGAAAQAPKARAARSSAPKATGSAQEASGSKAAEPAGAAQGEAAASETPPAEARTPDRSKSEAPRRQDPKDQGSKDQGSKDQGSKDQGSKDQGSKDQGSKDQGSKDQGSKDQGQKDQGPKDQGPKDQGHKDQGNQGNQGQKDQGNQNNQSDQGDDDEGRSGRNRRRRGRDRTRGAGPGAGPGGQQGGGSARNNEPDTTILEDDVLVPAAGILDVLDNYAFVRTSGYLPGTDDVYLSLSMVRKFGLRRGDAIVGQVRQPREGERKEKFNPMVRIDSVNGGDAQQAASRPDFDSLTPINPTERLRMETGAADLTGRAIDIAAPIGKGQRGLVVSAPKAGKSMVLKAIARAVTANNPECHLMVVLVDERPEEVTEFERTVKGEVIASTFDRPATDHTLVAELAIERAKRLVELGHDVVVLLDGITRLSRAYNLSVPASGRVLSGGVDAAALYPPKRFFGAARNVENGGSLTIVATALVESGSRMDEVIFDELRGTDNMELRLRRDLADKRLFPAIDVVESGTRREDLLLSQEEVAIVAKLRRTLASLDNEAAADMLISRLSSTQSNIEFLTQVQKTTPTRSGVE